MQNHTPDLSAPILALLVKNQEERFPFWTIESNIPLSASSIPPKPILESNYQLGALPVTMWQDEQLSKDWYVCCKSNTPHLKDQRPPISTHIAVNLAGSSEVVEGFVIELKNDNPEELAELYFLEIIRSGTRSEKELQSIIKNVVMGKLEMTDLTLTKGKNPITVEGLTVDGMFIKHPAENIIGWQYIYNHGGLAKPIRPESIKLVFASTFENGEPASFTFMEDKRGTIFHGSYLKKTTDFVPPGHVLNEEIPSEGILGPYDEATNSLAAVFAKHIQQFSGSGAQVEFYVTDANSAVLLAKFLGMVFENPMFWLKAPVVHHIPTWSGLYANPNSETGKCSIRRSHYVWQQMGLNQNFKESKVKGSLFDQAAKRHNGKK